MKISLIKILVLIMILSTFLVVNAKNQKKIIKEDPKDMKEYAFFKVNEKDKEILDIKTDIANNFKLNFFSVTVDQPIYWPNEDVYLKIVAPNFKDSQVTVSVQKKDATPNELGSFKLNEAGIFVKTIMSGAKSKLEIGEFRVEVKSKDGILTGFTTFSVVDGSLGALSFAYEFKQLTDEKELLKENGGWFLGNASGIGNRWGNGLNVKNQIRYLNQPYSGKAVIKSRCYLAGCNGVEAGTAIDSEIKDGSLQTVMDVGGHSGPFEIEIITDKGSLRYLFERSGHVERQSIIISNNVGYINEVTLAPYENTTPIDGKDIYLSNKPQKQSSALELNSPIADKDGEITFKAINKLKDLNVYIISPSDKNTFKHKKIEVASTLNKGDDFNVKCEEPYSFIAIGAFDNGNFYEAWTYAFVPTIINIDVKAQDSGSPNGKCQLKSLLLIKSITNLFQHMEYLKFLITEYNLKVQKGLLYLPSAIHFVIV